MPGTICKTLITAVSAAAFVLAMLASLWTHQAVAKTGTPSPLVGSWRGTGLVQSSSGRKQQVKCRANFQPAGSSRYKVVMTCVSRSKGAKSRTFTVRKTGNHIFSGRFHDAEAHLDVRAAIRLKGRHQVIELHSKKGRGRIEMSR